MKKEIKPLIPGTVIRRLTVIGKDEEKSEKFKIPFYRVKCSCESPIKSISKRVLMTVLFVAYLQT